MQAYLHELSKIGWTGLLLMFLRTVSSKRQLAGSLFCSALFIFGGKHMNAVIYRPYKRQDFKAVSSIINIIWKHESYYSPKTAVRLSEAYLRLCLTEQTFTQVALADGKPIGIIMGNHIRRHRCPLVLRLQAGWSVLVLSMTAEGRRSWRFLEEIDRIYAALLSGQPQEYRGELSFFAIHPDYHGQGIGRELFSHFCIYMERENIQHFYVFTDTSCNLSLIHISEPTRP